MNNIISSEGLNVHLFEYCDLADLSACCAVSKEWKKVAINDNLWDRLFPRVAFQVPAGFSIRTYLLHGRNSILPDGREFIERCIFSVAGMEKAHKLFLEKVQSKGNHLFVVDFIHNEEYFIKSMALCGYHYETSSLPTIENAFQNRTENLIFRSVWVRSISSKSTEVRTINGSETHKKPNRGFVNRHAQVAIPKDFEDLSFLSKGDVKFESSGRRSQLPAVMVFLGLVVTAAAVAVSFFTMRDFV